MMTIEDLNKKYPVPALEPEFSTYVWTGVRGVIYTAGGVLLGTHILTPEQLGTLADSAVSLLSGAAAALGAFAWSVLQKKGIAK